MNIKKMICISDLKSEKKWTSNLIKEFLGNPDKEMPNPYYPDSPTIKLYKLSRVIECEQSNLFIKKMEKINHHRELMSSINKRRVNHDVG